MQTRGKKYAKMSKDWVSERLHDEFDGNIL